MSQMLALKGELIRISPKDNHKIEYSKDGGRVWIVRYNGTPSTGEFQDIQDSGTELLAMTNKGLFWSKTAGRIWIFRSR